MNLKTPAARRLLLLALTPLLFVSCRSSNPGLPPPSLPKDMPRAAASKHPPVIVLDFENNSGFRGSWNLERLLPDRLNKVLYESGKLSLLDRSLFNTVAGQLARGSKTRLPDDLQRADYAISGTLTDFRSMRDDSGLFGPTLAGESQDQLACIISLTIQVADVQSGHLIEQFDRMYTLRADPEEDLVDYRSLDFGSNLFTYTPLGRVTDAVLADISESVLKIIKKDQSSGRKRDGLTEYQPESSRAPGTRATEASTTLHPPAPPLTAAARPATTTHRAAPPPATTRQVKPFVPDTSGKISIIAKEGELWVINAGSKQNLRIGSHALARTFNGSNFVVSGLLSIKSVTLNRSAAALIEGTVEEGSVLEMID